MRGIFFCIIKGHVGTFLYLGALMTLRGSAMPGPPGAFPLCLGLVALLTTPCWDNTLLQNTYIKASNKTVWIRGVYRGKVIRVG
jgi:hypothetical protein|nr:hypothetical protein Q903MT_gene2444 [Picea sitchensis]